jgi:hypothetical protein
MASAALKAAMADVERILRRAGLRRDGDRNGARRDSARGFDGGRTAVQVPYSWGRTCAVEAILVPKFYR